MENEIDDMVQRLVRLEDEIERKLEAQRAKLQYRMEEKRAVFEEEIIRQHKLAKTGLLTFLRHSPFATLIVTPAVYSLIVPIALLDIAISAYMLVCFSAWGVEKVRRSEFVIIDRHHLAYLNGVEKLNCLYCSYANGVIAFAREAASRTEQFWCPIKHALRVRAPHSRYRNFVDYGDADGFRARLDELRDGVRKTPKTPRDSSP